MHPDCKIYNVEQGSPEWHAARNGLITASEVKLILTPKLKLADNDKTRQHVYELAAQRISGYTEPTYIGDDMLRGHADELTSRDLYNEHYAPVTECGFITRDIGGAVIGYSPDGIGLIDDFGIECKSRRQKYQVQVITSNEVPEEHMLQVQAGLKVTGWDRLAYISYCSGLPMWVIDAEPIAAYQDAITEAVLKTEEKIKETMEQYYERISKVKVIETERSLMASDIEFGNDGDYE